MWKRTFYSVGFILGVIGGRTMATTGELRAIIEELELVDAGDAASYLDTNPAGEEESSDTLSSTLASCSRYTSSEDWNVALF